MDFDFKQEEFIYYPKIYHFLDYCKMPYQTGPSRFYVSEKIDGCNIGLSINRDSHVCAFSRNGEDANCGLFRFKYDSSMIEPLITQVVKYINSHDLERVYLFGEYFGSNVCNRIKYGVSADFRFYDGLAIPCTGRLVNNIRLAPVQLDAMFNELGAYLKDRFLVRFTEYRCDKNELYSQLVLPVHSEYCNDNAEGYVITLLDSHGYYASNFKLKDPNFSDRKSPKFKYSESKNLNTQFIDLINKNRALDLLSKTTERQIDKLARMLIDDAKSDFVNLNPQILDFDEKEQKRIFNARSAPFLILKSVIK